MNLLVFSFLIVKERLGPRSLLNHTFCNAMFWVKHFEIVKFILKELYIHVQVSEIISRNPVMLYPVFFQIITSFKAVFKTSYIYWNEMLKTFSQAALLPTCVKILKPDLRSSL